MASDPQKEKSGLEHTAQAAGAVKGAIKAGKALAGASKGAAFGPYGMAAGLAWEGRKVIAKVVIVLVALLLLPVMILTVLQNPVEKQIITSERKNRHVRSSEKTSCIQPPRRAHYARL